jgi:hypothetical protein
MSTSLKVLRGLAWLTFDLVSRRGRAEAFWGGENIEPGCWVMRQDEFGLQKPRIQGLRIYCPPLGILQIYKP